MSWHPLAAVSASCLGHELHLFSEPFLLVISGLVFWTLPGLNILDVECILTLTKLVGTNTFISWNRSLGAAASHLLNWSYHSVSPLRVSTATSLHSGASVNQ